MNVSIKNIIKGLLTLLPGGKTLLPKQVTGGTNTSYYCYEVWMKHLSMLTDNGLKTIPTTLAELGPGDSIGIGLAAILSGVKNYYALDVVEYSNVKLNLNIFDELVELFKKRASGAKNGWPSYSNHFPDHILTDELLNVTLSESRLKTIRKILSDPEFISNEITIKYMVPWSEKNIITEDSVDVIISHSVLEHVVDLDETYTALHSWLQPGGLMTHQIDFTSHGLSGKWNGYRAYPEFLWKIIAGKHTYLINRQPYSEHIRLLEENNFEIICNMQNYRSEKGINRSELSSYWKNISDDDLACSGAFIQSRKMQVNKK